MLAVICIFKKTVKNLFKK